MPDLQNNKIVTAEGETLIDLTSDTVTAQTLLRGVTAHTASGIQVTGTYDPSAYSTSVTGIITLSASGWSSKKQRINTGVQGAFILNTINITPTEMQTWADCKVIPVSEDALLGAITFGCETVPETDLTFTLTQTQLYSLDGFTGNGNEATGYIGDDTDVTIPSGVFRIAADAFSASSFTSVSVPDGVRIVGANAFENCNDLVSVNGTDTNNAVYFTTVGENAFSYCTSLTRIAFAAAVDIADSAFYECTGLMHIEFQRSTEISATAFYGCENVTEVVFASSWRSSADLSFTDKLTAACLSDIIDALADVTGSSEQRHLTLGSTNLARLSQAKLDEATAKGWYVS